MVTGGAGFIGSRVVSTLLEDGESLQVIDDLSSGRADAVPAGAELHQVDIVNPKTIAVIQALKPDLVIHCAAQVSVARSVLDPEVDARVNVVGTQNVALGAAAAGARRFIFLSSGGAIYGETNGATELSPPAPKSPYGKNKLRAEAIVSSAGVSFAIARLSNVYGPGQRTDQEGGVVAIFAEALVEGQPVSIFGDGRQRRDFIHVDDVVGALTAMALSDRRGIWNVATGQSGSVIGLLRKLEARLGPAVAVRQLPRRDGDVQDSCLRIERIERELAWRPAHDLDAGLDLLAASLRMSDSTSTRNGPRHGR